MEILVAIAIGAFMAASVWLILQRRSFPMVLGMTMMSYGINVFLFLSGRMAINMPPILNINPAQTDPIPQALVLTAIVIGFGMTAVIVVMAIGSFIEADNDSVDMPAEDRSPVAAQKTGGRL